MKRSTALIAALAFVIAACGGAAGDATTSIPTTTQPPVEAVLLSYTLSSGDEFQYEVDLDQHIEMSATGDPAMMGGEDLPGDASLDLASTATFTHVVSDGPEPGTYEVHITGDFTDVTITGVVDGEAITSEDAPEFAEMEPIDVTIVVDEQGRPVATGPSGAEDPFAGLFGDLGGLGSSGSPAPGLDPGQFIGPPLSNEEVTVGDTWTEEIETPGFGEEPIVTTITSTVTGVEQLGGTEVHVIESNSTTPPIELDLGAFFVGMLGAFAEEATPEESAELEALLEQLKFLMTIDNTTSDSRTLFDAEAGLVRESNTTAATDIKMDINLPDEETQQLVAFGLDMSVDQVIGYRLLSGPTA